MIFIWIKLPLSIDANAEFYGRSITIRLTVVSYSACLSEKITSL